MSENPKTIRIFLPFGNTSGIKIAEISGVIIKVIEVPRFYIKKFLERPESNEAGIYVLLGNDEVTQEPMAYIGQSHNVGSRLRQHDEKKDFWDRAIVTVSPSSSIHETQRTFLEKLAISKVKEYRRCEIDNKTIGNSGNLPETIKHECFEMFRNIAMLTSVLGYNIFKENKITINPEKNSDDTSEITVFANGNGVDACGRYTGEGLLVEKGSYGRREPSITFAQSAQNSKREAMIRSGDLEVDGDKLVFTKDYLFSSPSAAACCIYGRSSNGWKAWADSTGKTLFEYRNEK